MLSWRSVSIQAATRTISRLVGCVLTVSSAILLPAMAAAALQSTTDPPSQERPKEPPQGRPEEALKRLSIEELGRIAVLSASRHTEPAADAASAVAIVTADMLRRAGVTSLPDALRLAQGMAVGRDGHTWAVSARGFTASTSNKMVVLIDGRSVYTPLFSGVFWEAQDLILADIDRIEVIRGAGGTLWGANAVNGVINIITKLASDTQGALIQIGGGSERDIVALRYGGRAGGGHFRMYSKLRYYGAAPFETGATPDEALRAGLAGMRFDLGPASATSLTLQGDASVGRFGLSGSADGEFSGANVLGRVRHTYSSGSQLQFQWYYDTTRRRVPTQYTERRHTTDAELQYRFSAGVRHDLVVGTGLTVTHDRVIPSQNFFFDPESRTSPLLNVFAQDEIAILPGRLALILGSKFEHNDYTGFEFQPTVRMRWKPGPPHTVWAALSRAVRMPTRFDSDLRFTAGLPVVVLTGSPDFRSETVLGGEAGYRTKVLSRVSFGATVFANEYGDLRSQEPSVPAGVPIVLANKHSGRVSGLEVEAHVEATPDWQLWATYAFLHQRFGFDSDSRDTTGGSLEHNDPSHQVRLRSFANLPGGIEFDLTARWVGALPRPAVAAYGELTLRVARAMGRGLELELIGDNLLHRRHVELRQLGPVHAVPRSIFARLTWRSR